LPPKVEGRFQRDRRRVLGAFRIVASTVTPGGGVALNTGGVVGAGQTGAGVDGLKESSDMR
jgi:hypothetical protein